MTLQQLRHTPAGWRWDDTHPGVYVKNYRGVKKFLPTAVRLDIPLGEVYVLGGICYQSSCYIYEVTIKNKTNYYELQP